MLRFSLVLVFLVFFPLRVFPAQTDVLEISYLNHPSITGLALPIIKNAYQAAGIQAHFVEMPANRLLQLIDAGITDGDVLLAEEIFAPFNNIIKVGPPLTAVRFVLLCQPKLRCDHSVLSDSKVTLVSTDQSMRVIKAKYPQTQDTQFYNVNFLGKLPALLTSAHFDYAIYVMSKDWPIPKELSHLTVFPLFDSHAYHVLHKKHAALAEKIAPEIARQLAPHKTAAEPVSEPLK